MAIKISQDSEPYAFPDYLQKTLIGGNSRDTVEWEWHHESEAPEHKDYDPDGSKIDFQGPKPSEVLGDENS